MCYTAPVSFREADHGQLFDVLASFDLISRIEGFVSSFIYADWKGAARAARTGGVARRVRPQPDRRQPLEVLGPARCGLERRRDRALPPQVRRRRLGPRLRRQRLLLLRQSSGRPTGPSTCCFDAASRSRARSSIPTNRRLRRAARAGRRAARLGRSGPGRRATRSTSSATGSRLLNEKTPRHWDEGPRGSTQVSLAPSSVARRLMRPVTGPAVNPYFSSGFRSRGVFRLAVRGRLSATAS